MLVTGLSAFAQGIPDHKNEAPGALGFVQNVGQVINTDNNQITGINYHSLHATPKSYYSNSNINFVYASFAKDTLLTDTLARLDFTWIADGYGNTSTPTVFETSDEKVNYYLAHCNEGCDQLSVSKGLLYENIYDNIDLRMYSNNAGYKIYFVVKPGGNPQYIRMFFEGQTSLDVTLDFLTVTIGGNNFSLPGGIAYEYDAAGTSLLPWTPQFNLNTNGIVEVTGGAYNTNKTLVYELSGTAKASTDMKNIDWSVYFGGEGLDEFYDVEVNSIGAPQAAGYSYSANVPTVKGVTPYQASNKNAGTSDILLVKFNSNLSLSWSTFYGGTSSDGNKGIEEKYGISLDNNDNAFIAAPTMSNDIPLKDINSPQAYKDQNNGGSLTQIDLVIARFNTNGQLTWATFFGGNNDLSYEHFNGDIIVDKTTNEIYVAGFDSKILTKNLGSPSYYVSSTALTAFGAYITKFNANLQQVWCSYFGDVEQFNKINSLELDASGRLLLTGTTGTTGNIPVGVPSGSTGYYTQSYGNGGGGLTDAFIARFKTNLSVDWCTYIGGADEDRGNTIITTKNDKIIILGTTALPTGTASFPNYSTSVTNVFNQSTFGGQTAQTYADATVCTFDFDGQKENFTFLGGNYGEENSFAACANIGSNIFLAGKTHSTTFAPPSTANQSPNNYYVGTTNNIYSTPNDNRNGDVFIMGLNKNFVSQWSTFYGSSSGFDIFWANASFEKNVYFVGSTSGSDFPTTTSGSANAYSGSAPSSLDAIITRSNMNSTSLGLKNNLTISKNISIFPNPATNKLAILTESNIKDIYIYDLLGKLVKQMNMVNSKTKEAEIAIDDLNAGIYIIQVVDIFDAKYSSKFIKE